MVLMRASDRHFPSACRGKTVARLPGIPQRSPKGSPKWSGSSWEHGVPACPSHSSVTPNCSQAWSALATFVLFGQTPNAPMRENGENMSRENEVHVFFMDFRVLLVDDVDSLAKGSGSKLEPPWGSPVPHRHPAITRAQLQINLSFYLTRKLPDAKKQHRNTPP